MVSRSVARRITRRGVLRVLAVPAAVGLLWPIVLGLFVASIATGSGLKAPNPFVPDRSFESTPDSWGQAFGWIAASLVAWLLVLTAVSIVLSLAFFAGRGRLPSARFFSIPPVAGMALIVVVYAVVMVPQLGKGRSDVIDCKTFRLASANWRSNDDETHYETGFGIAECGSLTGKTRAEVVDLLKPQSIDPPDRHAADIGFDGLIVHFVRGRVVSVDKPYVWPIDDW